MQTKPVTSQAASSNAAPAALPISSQIPTKAKKGPKSGPKNPWPAPSAARRKSVSARSFKKQMVESQDALRRFAFRLCAREDMAEDLVQETLMKAWAARDQFKPGSKFLSWAFTILRNTWLNQLRRGKRFVADFDENVAEQLLAAPAQQTAPFELADLQRAMSELPTDQLEALMLVGPGDHTYDQAGEILGCAAGTVKSRASRARATLNGILADGKLKMQLEDTASAVDIADTFVAAIAQIENGGGIGDVINLKRTA